MTYSATPSERQGLEFKARALIHPPGYARPSLMTICLHNDDEHMVYGNDLKAPESKCNRRLRDRLSA